MPNKNKSNRGPASPAKNNSNRGPASPVKNKSNRDPASPTKINQTAVRHRLPASELSAFG